MCIYSAKAETGGEWKQKAAAKHCTTDLHTTQQCKANGVLTLYKSRVQISTSQSSNRKLYSMQVPQLKKKQLQQDKFFSHETKQRQIS